MKKKRPRRNALGAIEHDILRKLSAGDLLLSFLLSARSTRLLYREVHKRVRARYRYQRSIRGLEIRGLVKRNGDRLRLTKKGRDLLEVFDSPRQKQQAWSGRWWLVIYDIPVSMNAYRFELRQTLVRAGFRKLQHSVWISPEPCDKLKILLRRNPEFNDLVRYIETLPFVQMETLGDWKKLSKS